MIEYFVASCISCLIGIIAAIIGMGGGFLYVPTLTLIFGFDQRMAVGTSLAVMVFTSLSASVSYYRQRKILFPIAILLIIPSIFGAILGSYSTIFINQKILVAIFSIILILISIEMLYPTFRVIRVIKTGPVFNIKIFETDSSKKEIQISYLHILIWGTIGGFISGVTGTSGGVFFVPALLAVGIPVHYAVATSLFSIIITSSSAVTVQSVLGQISLPFVAAYGFGAVIGAFIGAGVATKIRDHHVQKIIGVILLFIALLMIKEKILGI